MTTTDSNGIVYLQDTDDISPFHTLINVLQAGTSNALNSKIRIARVANVTERLAVATAMGASASNPVYTHRLDATQGYELEVTVNATKWRTILSIDDTGWLPLTALQTGYTAPSGGAAMVARRIGNRVQFRDVQRNNAGVIAAGTTSIGTLPAGMAPPEGFYGYAPGWVSGTTGTSPVVEVIVSGAGVVSINVPGNTTGVRMHGITFLTD